MIHTNVNSPSSYTPTLGAEAVIQPKIQHEETAFASIPNTTINAEKMSVETAIMAKKIIIDTIVEIIGPKPFFIEAAKVEEIIKRTGISVNDLLKELVQIAKPLARPPISNYRVSEAGLGASGNIYLGVNLEFPGCPLNQAIHGEQTMVTLARNHGEQKLVSMVIPAEPCGFCRQFINEIGEDANELQILIPECEPKAFSDLLPNSFGPKNLGDMKERLLTPCKEFKSQHEDFLTAKAIEAAHNSYAPYTLAKSGVVIKTLDGGIFCGSYLENAAYNPSLSPLQTALVELVADGQQYENIIEVVLVEKTSAVISQEDTTLLVLKKISPQALFRVVRLEIFA